MNRGASFNHLIGAQYELGWNFMTDRLRGLEIENQLKTDRLFDGNVRRPGTAQNLHDNAGPLTIHLTETRTVSGNRACFRRLRPLKNCRQANGSKAIHDQTVT